MEKPKITWWVKDLVLNIHQQEYYDLKDRFGVTYQRYPKGLPSATFEITGSVEWSGANAWSQNKIDGLIPYLNEKLREYEELGPDTLRDLASQTGGGSAGRSGSAGGSGSTSFRY